MVSTASGAVRVADMLEILSSCLVLCQAVSAIYCIISTRCTKCRQDWRVATAGKASVTGEQLDDHRAAHLGPMACLDERETIQILRLYVYHCRSRSYIPSDHVCSAQVPRCTPPSRLVQVVQTGSYEQCDLDSDQTRAKGVGSSLSRQVDRRTRSAEQLGSFLRIAPCWPQSEPMTACKS